MLERETQIMKPEYPCPCCGYLVFAEPGSYEICPICFWEDDLSQLRFARTTGANHVSLVEAQANFIKAGVCELRFSSNVRAPSASDVREPQWRPLDVSTDSVEEPVKGMDYGNTYPDDTTQLYYWRDNYWRRQS